MVKASFDPAAELRADDRRNPFTGRAWDVPLCLLSDPTTQWRNASIAAASGLSRGFVSRVLVELVAQVPSIAAADRQYRGDEALLATVARHWPQPVAYLRADGDAPADRFPIGGKYAETHAGYTGADVTNIYISKRNQAYEVAALMTGGFVELHMANVAVTILDTNLLQPGPLPVWAFAAELCSTGRGREIWEQTSNPPLVAYRDQIA